MSEENKRLSRSSITSLNDDGKFDAVMAKVGTKGPFQKWYNITYNILLGFVTTMSYTSIILILAVPDHWCHVPGRENTNYTLEQWKNLTLPT